MEEWLRQLFRQQTGIVSDTPKELAWYERPLDMRGRATILPFKESNPELSGSVMNQKELAVPGLLAEAYNAIIAPGRAAQGLLNPEEAANFALNTMGGGLLSSSALKNPTGVGGKDIAMFVGQKSKTADDVALNKFYDLIDEGVSPTKAYERTGWMYGAEGMPKYEVSDAAASIYPEFMAGLANQTELKLGQVLNHPELYKAYPELKDTKFLITDKTPLAAYSPSKNAVLVNPKFIDDVIVENNPQRLRNALLHEVQHNVQKIEGFERGGSEDIARTAMFKQKDIEMNQLMKDIDKAGADSKSAIMDRNVYKSQLKNLQAQEVKSQDMINEIAELRNLLEKTEPLANKYQKAVKKYRSLEKQPDLELYKRLAGEAEARLTQQRQFIPSYEQRQYFPFKELDVPYDELIYRSLLD